MATKKVPRSTVSFLPILEFPVPCLVGLQRVRATICYSLRYSRAKSSYTRRPADVYKWPRPRRRGWAGRLCCRWRAPAPAAVSPMTEGQCGALCHIMRRPRQLVKMICSAWVTSHVQCRCHVTMTSVRIRVRRRAHREMLNLRHAPKGTV